MFTTLLRTGILAILLNDYLKRNYPDKYQELLYQVELNKHFHLIMIVRLEE